MIATDEADKLPFTYDNLGAMTTERPTSEPINFDFQSMCLTFETAELLRESDNLARRFDAGIHISRACHGLAVVSELTRLLQTLFQVDCDGDVISRTCCISAALHIANPLRGRFPDPSLIIGALIQQLKTFILLALASARPPSILLLWWLTSGGLAAEHTPERRWFVSRLALLFREFQLVIKLRSVICFAQICTGHLNSLWQDVEAIL